VGDRAFYRQDLALNQGEVYALAGQLLVDLHYGGVTAQNAAAIKQCLTQLASDTLAAQ
jgi:hypothetical protein